MNSTDFFSYFYSINYLGVNGYYDLEDVDWFFEKKYCFVCFLIRIVWILGYIVNIIEYVMDIFIVLYLCFM